MKPDCNLKTLMCLYIPRRAANILYGYQWPMGYGNCDDKKRRHSFRYHMIFIIQSRNYMQECDSEIFSTYAYIVTSTSLSDYNKLYLSLIRFFYDIWHTNSYASSVASRIASASGSATSIRSVTDKEVKSEGHVIQCPIPVVPMPIICLNVWSSNSVTGPSSILYDEL